MLVHNVYFTLHDGSPEAVAKLVASCQRHLSGHEGVTYFAVSTLVPDLTRPVNDLDFHVGLHIVFADRAAHDNYQPHERHQKFIAENKASWKQVRVFDSYSA
jgi:hypothetical protein